MRVKLLRDCDTAQGKKKAGTEIDHPDSWMLVKMGIARAVDEEAIACLKAIGLNSNGEVVSQSPGGAVPKPEPTPEVRPAPPPPLVDVAKINRDLKKAKG